MFFDFSKSKNISCYENLVLIVCAWHELNSNNPNLAILLLEQLLLDEQHNQILLCLLSVSLYEAGKKIIGLKTMLNIDPLLLQYMDISKEEVQEELNIINQENLEES